MQIRMVRETDLESLRQLFREAFEEEGEAVSNLALSLIEDKSAQPRVTLVAEEGDRLVGSVIFSAVTLEGAEQICSYILAPLAVVKDVQRSGIGRKLIESGCEALCEQDGDAVFVLGDPEYYGRHGFFSKHHVHPPYELPYPEAWMARSLRGISLESLQGRLICADSLMRPELW